MMMNFKHTNEPIADIGFAVADALQSLAENHSPDLAHFFPFKHSFNAEGEIIDNLIIVRVKSVSIISATVRGGCGQRWITSLLPTASLYNKILILIRKKRR